MRYIRGEAVSNQEEHDYIFMLVQNGLLKENIKYEQYECTHTDIKLNFAWLEITQACNLRCIHCYEGENHRTEENSLSTQEWKRIIRELFDVKCHNIQFIGGEPSCYVDIIELVDFARTFDFNSIGFFTNATIITDEMIDCFVRNNVTVNVSIYGHTAELHDSITTICGSFDKTISHVNKMINKGIKVNAAITVMKENEDSFEDIVAFAKAVGMKYSKFDLVREVCGCKQDCHSVTRNDLIKKKYRTQPSFVINKGWFNKAYLYNTCWYGKFAIAESGDVLPCVFEREIKYGNLKNRSIKELLNSIELKKYWFMDFSQINECKVCEYRFACKDCRPLGMINGGIDKKNKRCLYNPLMGVWDKIPEEK